MLNTQWGTLIENARAGVVAFIDFSLGDTVVVEAGAAGFACVRGGPPAPWYRGARDLPPSLGFGTRLSHESKQRIN